MANYDSIHEKTLHDSFTLRGGATDVKGYQTGTYTRPSLCLSSGDTKGVLKVFEYDAPKDQSDPDGYMFTNEGHAALVVKASSDSVAAVPVIVDGNLAVTGALTVVGDMGVEEPRTQLRAHRILAQPDYFIDSTVDKNQYPAAGVQADFCIQIQGGQCEVPDSDGNGTTATLTNNLLLSRAHTATDAVLNELKHTDVGLTFTSKAVTTGGVDLLSLGSAVGGDTVSLRGAATNTITLNGAATLAMLSPAIQLGCSAGVSSNITMNAAGIKLQDNLSTGNVRTTAELKEDTIDLVAIGHSQYPTLLPGLNASLTLGRGNIQARTTGSGPGAKSALIELDMGGNVTFDAGEKVQTTVNTTFKTNGPISVHQLTGDATEMEVATSSTTDFTLKSTGAYSAGDHLPVWPAETSPLTGLSITLHKLLSVLFSFFKSDRDARVIERRDYFSEDYVNMPNHEEVEKAFQEALETENQSLSVRDLRTAITIVNRKINAIMGLTPPETVNSIKELAERLRSVSPDVGYSVAAELAGLQAQISNLYRVHATTFPPAVPNVNYSTYELSSDLYSILDSDLRETSENDPYPFTTGPRVLMYSTQGSEVLSRLQNDASPITGFSEIVSQPTGLAAFHRIHNYYLSGSGVERLSNNGDGKPIPEQGPGDTVAFPAGGIGYMALDGKSGFFYDINMKRYVYCDGLDLYARANNANARVPATRVYKAIWNNTAQTPPYLMQEYELDAYFHTFKQLLTGGVNGIIPRRLKVDGVYGEYPILEIADGSGGTTARRVSMLLKAHYKTNDERVLPDADAVPIMPTGKAGDLDECVTSIIFDFTKSLWSRNGQAYTYATDVALRPGNDAAYADPKLTGYLSFLIGSFTNEDSAKPTIKVPKYFAGRGYIDEIVGVTSFRTEFVHHATELVQNALGRTDNNRDVAYGMPAGYDLPIVQINRTFTYGGLPYAPHAFMDYYRTTARGDDGFHDALSDWRTDNQTSTKTFYVPLFQNIHKPPTGAKYFVGTNEKTLRFKALFSFGDFPEAPLLTSIDSSAVVNDWRAELTRTGGNPAIYAQDTLQVVKSSEGSLFNLETLGGYDTTLAVADRVDQTGFWMNDNHSGLMGAYAGSPLAVTLNADFNPYSFETPPAP